MIELFPVTGVAAAALAAILALGSATSPSYADTDSVRIRIIKQAFVPLVAVALVVFGAASGALAGSERWPRGGFVKACSLDGVNPVYHGGIFGNPAIARSYGFVRWRDGTWRVVNDCHIY